MKTVLRRKDILFPELSYKIIGSAFDVYNELGPGHFEKYYQKALADSLQNKGLNFQEQVYCPVIYNNKIIGKRLLDFLVEGAVIIEIKKGDRFSKSHIDQVLDYLKTNDLKLAILINFGSNGVLFRRVVNFN